RRPSTTDDATVNMYTVAEWREAVVKGLDALEEALDKGATVRVVSMPRVDLLKALGTTEVSIRQRPLFGGEPATPTRTCEYFWALAALGGAAICPIVTAESSADKLSQIGRRIDEYNAALAEEVRGFRSEKEITFQSDWHGSIEDNEANRNTSGGTFV